MLLNRTYFETYQEKIKVVNSPCDKRPNAYLQPFSDISIVVGQLNFKETIIIKHEEQILKFTNNNGYPFILKRFAIYYDKTEEELKDLLQVPRIRNYLNNAFKQFYISKIVAAHPAGIIAFDFRITKLVNLKCLVTEFLMEDAGEQLHNYFKNGTLPTLDCIKIFRQISNVMRFLESLQIVYNDVKLGNFLIDGKGNIRIIDYDVSQASSDASLKSISGIQQILEFSPGFVSPEALKSAKKVQNTGNANDEDLINTWKADIYSCGILGLCLTGAVTANDILNSLDSNKRNSNDHNKILKLIEKVKCQDNITTLKMRKILESCLQFDPLKRMTFKCLNELMISFSQFSSDEVISFIDKAASSKEAPREQLHKRIEVLESALDKFNQDKLQWELKTREDSKKLEELKHELTLKDGQQKQLYENFKEHQNLFKNYIKEKEEIINLLYGTNIPNSENINLLDIVQKEIFIINEKLNSETKKYENEKSLILENCIEILEKFNKELPNDINDIPRIIRILLDAENAPPENAIASKYENYNDAVNQMVKGQKLSPEITNYILECNDEWFLNQGVNEATTEEIVNIMELVKLSNTLNKITFLKNPNFNKECEKAYLEAIKANNSLITIILCQTNASNQIAIEMLKMLKVKQKIKVLIVEQAKLSKNDANELAKNMNLEINNWNSKYWRKINKGKKYKFY